MAFSADAFFNDSREPLFSLSLASQGGTLVAANPAFLRLVGRNLEEMLGTPFASFVTEQSQQSLQSAMAAARTGQRARFHVMVRNQDETEHALEANGTPSDELFHCVGRRVLWVGDTATGHVSRDVLFQNVVRGVLDALGPRQVMVTRGVDWPVTRAEVLAGWVDGHALEPFAYDVAGMPCQNVMYGEVVTYARGLREVFPNVAMLEAIHAESYFGVPVRDEVGAILGSICVVDDKPMLESNHGQILAVLQSASRAASRAMARMRAESLLAMGIDSSASLLEGSSLFHAVTRQTALAMQVDMVFASEYEDPPTHARLLSMWDGTNHVEGIRYPVENTPCGIVARGEICQIPRGSSDVFPGNPTMEKTQSVIAVPVLDSRGKTIGVMTIAHSRPMDAVEERALSLRLFAGRVAAEIERMRSAKVAAESDARFRLLVEHAADMLFVHERDGTILECNRAAGRELLVPSEDLIAKNLADIRQGVTAEDIARDGELLEAGEPRTFDAVFRRSDGTTFPAEVRTVLFEHAGKQIAISSARDVTEQKRAAALLEAALAAMSTPIIEVWEKTVALPVIGMVDRERAARMMSTLLDTITQKQAEFAILDLTGVTTVDAETANHLLDIARAASLLGSDCLVSGISPAVARTLVDLGSTETSTFRTFATLEAALRHALGQRGVRISKRA
ncbi:MAG: PAS domain S-box protein [Polyangiaceae bacterium]|nr:PAS domain S-box protein [Polyangiaceae bacterium]